MCVRVCERVFFVSKYVCERVSVFCFDLINVHILYN